MIKVEKAFDVGDCLDELEHVWQYFHALVFSSNPAALIVPDSVKDSRKIEEIAHALLEARRALFMASKGDFSYKIASKGFLAGTLKSLQANLNHLSWMARRIANGDMQQRVSFMGDFSESFNSMVEQLSSTLKKLRTEEERWQLALLCSRDGVWEVKLDSREPPHYSPHIFDMLGLSPENPPDIAEWPKFFHPNDHKLLTLYRRFALWKDPPYSFELDHRLRCADGGYRWFMTRGMTLLDPVGGKPLRIIGVMADIQDRKEREEFFSYRATHDALTDLPNRMLFDEHLRSGIAVARRAGSYLAVVMVDLDRFKFINDTMGHHAGDQLLVEVAGRLLKNMRESDIASRLGGDEFAMILAFGKDELRAVTKVLERIMHALNKPVMLEDKEMLITASFGVSVYPNDGDLPKELMIRADEAMYHAKSLGRNACVFWQPDGRYSAVRFEAE